MTGGVTQTPLKTTTPCHVLVERRNSAGPAPESQQIRLFSKCRNERLRLPAFLKHYRGMGVDRFFIVDNGSSDGTTEYLLNQPDVHVFRTEGRFREARGGTDWLNALLAEFGVGCWCVTVDIDELLYYPGSEHTPLPRLTAYLEEKGCEALSCLLLDLYPPGPLRDCAYRAGDDLVAAAPYFDIGPYQRLPMEHCPGWMIRGGVRERLFYPECRARSVQTRVRNMYHRLLLRLPVVRRKNWVYARRPTISPLLTKVPLVRWDGRSRYLNVNHFVSPKTIAAETGVLLHFKFLQDFHDRAMQEAARGEYYDGAIEYLRYAERLSADPALTLVYEGSMRFDHSSQLVKLGLMQDTASWGEARG